MATPEKWARSQWFKGLPPDLINPNDVVVDRWFESAAEAKPTDLAPKAKSKEKKAPSKLSSADVAKIDARLAALEESFQAEARAISTVRSRIDATVVTLGATSAQVPTGLPVSGLFTALGGHEALLFQVMDGLDFRSRARLRTASREVQALFGGAQVVLSNRHRPGKGDGITLPHVEVKAQRFSMNPAAPSFLVDKTSVKVVSLKAGDEVFFRPALLGAKYDAAQDWPRSRVVEMRADGIVVCKAWSWRLTNAAMPTLYLQWQDVRRAPLRSKFQMLPEQRVWRASELKEEATKLLVAAMADEQAVVSWLDHCKTSGTAAAAAAGSSAGDGNGGAKAAATIDESKAAEVSSNSKPAAKAGASNGKASAAATKKTAEKAPLLNSAVVFLEPTCAALPKCAALVKSTLAARGLSVVEEGTVSGNACAAGNLADVHFKKTAIRAMDLKPHELIVGPAQRSLFEQAFGIGWFDAMASQQLVNAASVEAEIAQLQKARASEPTDSSSTAAAAAAAAEAAKEAASVSLAGLRADADAKGAARLGSCTWVGKIELPAVLFGKSGIPTGIKGATRYVVNGFYPSVRRSYAEAGNAPAVAYMVVEWAPEHMPWRQFRSDVIGAPGYPSTCAPGSLRRLLADQWQELGLAAAPSPRQPGAHGSGSPVAALLEKLNWVHAGRLEAKSSGNGASAAAASSAKPRNAKGKATSDGKSAAAATKPTGFALTSDAFGKALLGGSMSESTLRGWALDPEVTWAGGRAAVLSEVLLDVDAPACRLKARACAADCARKLDAAKQKYVEAVSYVEGDNIGDPDGNSRVVTVPPCASVQAGILEAKVTTYTAVALCARKLAQALDREPGNTASAPSASNGATTSSSSAVTSRSAQEVAQQERAQGMKKLHVREVAQQERAQGMKKLHVREMAEFGLKAARECELMAVLHEAGVHKKSLANGKEVPPAALAVCKAVLSKHPEAKFLGLMRVKAVYFAALGLSDQECPLYDLELALQLLRQARQVHQNYIPATPPAAGEASASKSAKESSSNGGGAAAGGAPPLPADLKKQLEAQRKEVDALFRRSMELKKKEAAKGKKRWSAAFEKNAKDPNAGLPPPKVESNVAAGASPAAAAPLPNAMLNDSGVMDPSALLGGALGMQPTPPPKLSIQDLGNGASSSSSSSKPAQAAPKKAPAAAAADEGNGDDDEEADDSLSDMSEMVYGGVLLAAVVGVGYLAQRWFSRRT